MRLRIEFAEDLTEDEVIIRCREVTPAIQSLQSFVSKEFADTHRIVFYKKNEEHFLPLDNILFFETAGEHVYAHTAADVYRVKYRLYELEDFLPVSFVRISKSAILNARQVLSLERNLSSSSLVQFYHSHKQVYVSRSYYKSLKIVLTKAR